MSTRFFAVVLLVVFGVVSLFLVGPRISGAQWRSCSVPKSAGVYREGYGNPVIVFESKDGTLSFYNTECQLAKTVTRN